MNIFESLEDGMSDKNKLLLREPLIFSRLQQIKECAIGTILHKYDKNLIIDIAISQSHKLSSKAPNYIFAFGKFHLLLS